MLLAQDAAYHVMSRGHNREAIFADPDDVRYFLGLLVRYRERLGFRLYHYCVLANHFHLLPWRRAAAGLCLTLHLWPRQFA